MRFVLISTSFRSKDAALEVFMFVCRQVEMISSWRFLKVALGCMPFLHAGPLPFFELRAFMRHLILLIASMQFFEVTYSHSLSAQLTIFLQGFFSQGFLSLLTVSLDKHLSYISQSIGVLENRHWLVVVKFQKFQDFRQEFFNVNVVQRKYSF